MQHNVTVLHLRLRLVTSENITYEIVYWFFVYYKYIYIHIYAHICHNNISLRKKIDVRHHCRVFKSNDFISHPNHWPCPETGIIHMFYKCSRVTWYELPAVIRDGVRDPVNGVGILWFSSEVTNVPILRDQKRLANPDLSVRHSKDGVANKIQSIRILHSLNV